MDPARRAFYQFHASLMEPWDGPACVTFTDGTLVGAVLDRNGLRPARWWRTVDGRVVLASEAGVLDVPRRRRRQGPAQAGPMFLRRHRGGQDRRRRRDQGPARRAASLRGVAARGPVPLDDAARPAHVSRSHASVLRRQLAFGYTEEELQVLLAPMALEGAEPLGSMGTDTPVAGAVPAVRACSTTTSTSCSRRSPTRRSTPSARSSSPRCRGVMGPEQNLLAPGPASCRQIAAASPVIDNDELAKLIHVNDDGDLPGFSCTVLSGLYEVDGGGEALAEAIERVRQRGVATRRGRRPHPRALRPRLRPPDGADSLAAARVGGAPPPRSDQGAPAGRAGGGDAATRARCTTSRCCSATVPRRSTRTWRSSRSRTSSRREPSAGSTPRTAVRNYIKALSKGVLKIMSKMGISTVGAYTGAQVFEALGLVAGRPRRVLHRHRVPPRWGRPGRARRGGRLRHRRAYPENPAERAHRGLESGGDYAYRREGELHLFTPETVFLLQHASASRR